MNRDSQGWILFIHAGGSQFVGLILDGASMKDHSGGGRAVTTGMLPWS